MTPKRDISQLFNKFAGQVVKDPNRLTCDTDPVIDKMGEVAQKNGLTLRVLWPGTRNTHDMRSDRVNAHIKKGADGKWRVSNRFRIG